MKIHSKKLNKILTFSQPRSNGYVYVDINGMEGILGRQICKGGRLMGSTITCNDQDFEKVCRVWYRAYLKNQSI